MAASRWISIFQEFVADLRIDSKEAVATDDRGVKLDLWDSQKRFLHQIGTGLDLGQRIFYCLKSRQLGCCLHPDTRVLKADLTWSKIADLKPGDEVIAVDEHPAGERGKNRKMKTATVQGLISMVAETFRISFEDGRSVVCTGNHPWLSQKPGSLHTNGMKWRTVERSKKWGATLKPGDFVRSITKPWGDSTVEDGWIGGMLDGEGSMSNQNRTGAHACICQKRGEVFDRAEKYLSERGYFYGIESDASVRSSKFGKEPCPKLTVKRMDELFRLFGQTRPTRFVSRRWWEGREMPGKRSGHVGWQKIISIEAIGPGPVVDLQTSAGTYIAEGLVSHNTTVSLAIDVCWMAMHSGLIGCLVTDNEANRDAARQTIRRYIASFPEDYFGDSFTIKSDNRNYMLFSNGSRLDFLVAGTREKSVSWAEGKGYAYAHLTECSKYGSPKGLASLEESFAQSNPNRLFLYESTANGFNHWRTKWLSAPNDPTTKRSFFLGWWSSGVNFIARSDPRFLQYGLHPASGEEREKVAAVASMYGHKITPEQLAWIRWKEANVNDDDGIFGQNQPWTSDDAFLQTGHSFFQTRAISTDMQKLLDAPVGPVSEGGIGFTAYRYDIDGGFFNIALVPIESEDEADDIELRVWEEPISTGRYVIGMDPAWGRNDHKDRHAIQVYRCYADRMVQVAEYATADVEVKHAAWVVAHLAGSYADCIVNLELAGPGRALMMEWDHIRGLLNAEMNATLVQARDWENALGNARWYLYNRPDSMGRGFCANFETTWRTKQEIMHQFRGCYVSGELVIRSLKLLQEMQGVVQDGSDIGAPESSGENNKDDRVFATALAIRAWINWVRPSMLAEGLIYERVRKDESGETTTFARSLNGQVSRFFKTAQERAEMVPRAPQFLIDRGLA